MIYFLNLLQNELILTFTYLVAFMGEFILIIENFIEDSINVRCGRHSLFESALGWVGGNMTVHNLQTLLP